MRYLVLVLAVVFWQSGCATKTEIQGPPVHRTFLRSEIPPAKILSLSEQFFEWQKGFVFRIRDRERGLLVSDWVRQGISERSQLTVKVLDDGNGSIISTHLVQQVFQGNAWHDLPSSGIEESGLLAELEDYLKTHKP